MTARKIPKVDNIVKNGVDMVRVSFGNETLELTIDQAHNFSKIIETVASMPASLAHIDAVFDGWGSGDGGTC